jgi:Fe-Mn family superoxide dismutase
MAYTVPDLAYPFDALEPHIDARTMEIHHDKHHGAYVTNLNAALEGTEWMDRPIDAVLANLEILPEDKRTAVRNNGGGHANHTLCWEIMGPGGGGEPSGELAATISDTFGSLDDLKSQVNDAGVKRFGSGWSWLVWDGTGLAVLSTPNQDSPVMEGNTPILGVDVWEHAYYLNYQNRRPDYLAAWWNVGDWNAVAAKFDAARSSGRSSTPRIVAWSAIGAPRKIRSAAASVFLSMDAAIALRTDLPFARRAASIPAMSAESRTDAELLELIAGGDRNAFEELHRRYARSVLGIALRRLGDRGRAEDVTQDTFASVWRSASRYDPERGQAASWLYTVARNAIVDGLRRRPPPTVANPPDVAAGDPGPAEEAETEWVSWRVHRAVESLPDHERSLVELAYWSGLSQSEIAEYVGLPLGTVKTRTRAALRRLADELEGELR